jgi:adenylate cyclase
MFNEKLLKKALKLYAGEHVLKRVLELGEDALSLNGVPQELTLMFIQVIPAYLPEQEKSIPDINNAILKLITCSILDNGGVVDSFIGTDVFAFWGIDGKPGHAEQAARCALDIVVRANTPSINGLSSIETQIGINTGTVLIGNTGSESRMKFTVLGDAVNLVSGLTSLCASYPGVNILMTEFTQSRLGESFNLKNAGQINVKGRDKEVALFTLH